MGGQKVVWTLVSGKTSVYSDSLLTPWFRYDLLMGVVSHAEDNKPVIIGHANPCVMSETLPLRNQRDRYSYSRHNSVLLRFSCKLFIACVLYDRRHQMGSRYVVYV